jgi:hypothetical protein
MLAQEAPAEENVLEKNTGLMFTIVIVLLVLVVAYFVWYVKQNKQREQATASTTAPPVLPVAAPPDTHPGRSGGKPVPTPGPSTRQRSDQAAPANAGDTSAPVGVFISYRRNDAPHLAGRLFDRLREHFGNARIFMDVDSIEPGLDFGEVIADAVRSCKVMLVIIGPNWLTTQDGNRRIDSPDDYVRIELEHALGRGIRVIPVLVDGAVMPSSADLPDALESLARRNAVEVTHRAFTTDADRLIELTDRLLTA